MSVKKLIALTVVSVASIATVSVGLAGEPEYTPSYTGFYIEGNAGYVYHPWLNDVTTFFGAVYSTGFVTGNSRGNGGFAGGVDLGYQFNEYVSIEAGWMYLARTSVTFAPALGGGTVSVNSGLAYAAFKGMAPIYENTYIFGKLGGAYTYNTFSLGIQSSNGVTNVTNTNFWNPMFAAGLQYYFTPEWSINFQYAYVPGYRRSSGTKTIAPDSQLITAGIGYKFLM